MKRIFIKEAACIGCHLCEIYCREAHSQSKDLIKAFKSETPSPIPRLRVEVKDPISLSVQCQQCEQPFCVYACLTGALYKDSESGIISVDTNKCVGCGTCLLACPFGAIRRDTQTGKIAKCDLCQGEDVPVCVSNCPNEALTYAEVQSEN